MSNRPVHDANSAAASRQGFSLCYGQVGCLNIFNSSSRNRLWLKRGAGWASNWGRDGRLGHA